MKFISLGTSIYYKLRKKWLRAIQTLRGNNNSDFKHVWTPKYRLEYYKSYRFFIKELKFEESYEEYS